MYKNKLMLALLVSGFLTSAYANQQELGDSKDLGLGNKATQQSNASTKPPEKISNYGDGVSVSQYNDFGQPIVQINPERGPSYYYNQNEIQAPNPEDGVRDREVPEWRLGEW